MYYDDYDDGCPGCGVRDYGWELSDTRGTLYHGDCSCKGGCTCEQAECPCDEGDDCSCERSKIQIQINRIWDQECDYCGGVDWRPEWLVLKDGKTVATVPSEAAAWAVVEAEFPSAESDYDPDWESERWLRRAEGWG